MADADDTIHFRWEWDLPAPAEKLWPLVSDTNRFNRDTGLPTVTDDREEGEELENARRKLRMKVNGVIPVAWEELPFEWVRPWRFGVVRRYPSGPMSEMRVLAELSPIDADSTKLVYSVAAVPRGVVGKLAIHLQIGVISKRAFEKAFRSYAEHVRDTGTSTPVPMEDPRAVQRMSGMVGRLVDRGVDTLIAEKLITHLSTADDLSIVRIRPALLARLWMLPRQQVLEACLEAVRLGVLDLQWDLLCPSCGGSKEELPTLSDLRTRVDVHCDTCRIDFSVDFDRSVELSFRLNPQYRVAPDAMFCVAGPQITPQVVVQQLLEPHGVAAVNPLLPPGGYRVRVLGGTAGSSFVVDPALPATTEVEVSVGLEGIHIDGAPSIGISPEITLRNDTPAERLVKIERTAWTDDVVTAAEVTLNQKFRDLFTSEVLDYGEFVSVGTLTIVFTDLQESTRLYQRIGDATAYGRVMDHFQVLRHVFNQEGGTVVKTIGDAIMAVFPEPKSALVAIEAGRRELRRADPEDPLVLKAGVHIGPCIAVTLNDRLDYFGTTVNVAARLGALSSGADIVVSDEVRADPGTEEFLMDSRANLGSQDVALKGIERSTRVWRIVPGFAPGVDRA